MLISVLIVSMLVGQAPELVDRTLAIVAGRTVTLSDARTALGSMTGGACVGTAIAAWRGRSCRVPDSFEHAALNATSATHPTVLCLMVKPRC